MVVAAPKVQVTVGRHGDEVGLLQIRHFMEMACAHERLGPDGLVVKVFKTRHVTMDGVDGPLRDGVLLIETAVP